MQFKKPKNIFKNFDRQIINGAWLDKIKKFNNEFGEYRNYH